MSSRLVGELWNNKDSGLGGSSLLVMLCLADWSNEEGECIPSIARIAEHTRLARRSVINKLRELEDMGYITITRTDGKRNRYFVRSTSANSALVDAQTSANSALVDAQTSANSALVAKRDGEAEGAVFSPYASGKNGLTNMGTNCTLPEGTISTKSTERESTKFSSTESPVSVLGGEPKRKRVAVQAIPKASNGKAHQAVFALPLDQTPPLVESGSEIAQAEPRVLTEQQQFYRALCEVCHLDEKVMRGHVARTVKTLRDAGYTSEQVAAFPGWWYKSDWRGAKGQPPTLQQIAQHIKQSVDGVQPNGKSRESVPQNISEAVDENFIAMLNSQPAGSYLRQVYAQYL